MAGIDRGGVQEGRGALTDGDTIVALSSGALPAAIAIVRISGPHAFAAASAVAGRLPPFRRASLRPLRDAQGALLDRAVVLVFAAASSATGEDVVEFHCHGGKAVVAAVERALLTHPDVRAAEPGEFTRRALLHGRIDFSQAQGLADLLAAETEGERRHALRAAEGAVRKRVEEWLDRLTAMAAQVEASIDFAEEGDVVAEAASLDRLEEDRRELIARMDEVLAVPPVERWKDGWRVVIAGSPNAGKSTLLNLLAGRDAAIVSPEAGTTRDMIEATVTRNGMGYVLVDTAGLRDDPTGMVEVAGIERALDAATKADILLWMDDTPPPDAGAALRIHGRADLPDRHEAPATADVAVSRDDAASVEHLWQRIEQLAGGFVWNDHPALRRRDRDICHDVAEMVRALPADLVLMADTLRQARQALGTIIGIDATESMLDRLFASFCIGK